MNIRIDPLDDNGKFDHETYEREDYQDLKEAVLRYLSWEGFEKPGEYFITLINQNWHVHIK